MGIDDTGVEKAIKTKRKKYGKDAFSTWGKLGAGKTRPGYFGWLKINDPKKLKEIQDKAVAKRKGLLD